MNVPLYDPSEEVRGVSMRHDDASVKLNADSNRVVTRFSREALREPGQTRETAAFACASIVAC
jgi:hypothetical protein